MSDPNELTEEEKKRLGIKSNIPNIEAEIIVSGKSEIERLEREKEDLKVKLEQIADAEFQRAKRKHGAGDDITTPEELKAFIEGKSSIKIRNPALTTGSGASGKALLDNEPNYGDSSLEVDSEGKLIIPNDWLDKEYASSAEMVAVLRAVEKDVRRKDRERQYATKLLNEMTKRVLEGEKGKPTSATFHGTFKDLAAGKSTISDWKKTTKKDLKEE